MNIWKLLRKTKIELDEGLVKARTLSNDSAIHIVDSLFEEFESVGLTDWVGTRRSPATSDQIDAAEKRLNTRFPESIRDFYLEMNGIENSGGELPYSVYAVHELEYGHNSKPKISQSIRKVQKDYDQIVGEDIQVMDTKSTMDLLLSTFADKHMATIPVEMTDNFILISSCSGHTVGVCVEDVECIPSGGVLDFEGTTGTYYTGIKHWLASGLG